MSLDIQYKAPKIISLLYSNKDEKTENGLQRKTTVHTEKKDLFIVPVLFMKTPFYRWKFSESPTVRLLSPIIIEGHAAH